MQYLFKICCLISKHLDFFLETLLLGFNLITAELENIFCLFSNFLKFMKAFLITQNIVILVNVPMHLKRMLLSYFGM